MGGKSRLAVIEEEVLTTGRCSVSTVAKQFNIPTVQARRMLNRVKHREDNLLHFVPDFVEVKVFGLNERKILALRTPDSRRELRESIAYERGVVQGMLRLLTFRLERLERLEELSAQVERVRVARKRKELPQHKEA